MDDGDLPESGGAAVDLLDRPGDGPEEVDGPPPCGHAWRGVSCEETGAHFCETRVAKVVFFFHTVLVHTKGRWARRPFILAGWQERILARVFGRVEWDDESESYVRVCRILWIEVARKNGKSEMLAGIALYLLVADDEEMAEVYGAAKDKDQARKVFDVAVRMVQLSPILSKRLKVTAAQKRIVDERTASYYEVIAADAAGNLGHNPHGVVFDEVLTQPNGDLWDALRTGMGARTQPLIVAATTAGNDKTSFAGREHEEYLKIADEPERAPHIEVYIKNVPEDADPWDESLWPDANPALGDFLSLKALQQEAQEARNDPRKENAFRQYRLNQWVQQATRWMPMYLWTACAGDEPAPSAEWLDGRLSAEDRRGRASYAGLDLSSKHDLTSWCVVMPRLDGRPADVFWRFWLPEGAFAAINKHTSEKAQEWVRAGWLTLTEGDVIDYDVVIESVLTDVRRYKVAEIDYDKWAGEPVRQAILNKLGRRFPMIPVDQTFVGMTMPLTEAMNTVLSTEVCHYANPVAEWCFDAVEVKHAVDNPDLIKPVKPDRGTARRIDGAVAYALAVRAWRLNAQVKRRSAVSF